MKYHLVREEEGKESFSYKIADENGISFESVEARYIDGHYALYTNTECGVHIFGIEDSSGIADERLKEKASELIKKVKARSEHIAH